MYLNEKESTKAVKYYDITLHQNMHKIGFIRVYLRVFNRRLGNIGYVLQEEYQGNHYILQALELLREPMLHYGLNKIMITASPDNYASIQTIENFGGKLISGIVEGYHYNTYEVSLEEENKNSKKTF